MNIKVQYDYIKPYITKDRSIIRELVHPDNNGNLNHSLAAVRVSAIKQY